MHTIGYRFRGLLYVSGDGKLLKEITHRGYLFRVCKLPITLPYWEILILASGCRALLPNTVTLHLAIKALTLTYGPSFI